MDLPQFSPPSDNFKLIYSPRTTYDFLKASENKLYIQLLQSFNPETLSILKRHFKEHLGSITKEIFICTLKLHLSLTNSEIKVNNNIMIKLLSKLFDEIDLNSKEIINWNQFSNFLVNFNEGKKIKKYYLKKYYESKININPVEQIHEFENKGLNFHNTNKDKVNYCFYIEKFRFLGLMKEGSSKIIFFNIETNKRLKLEIDFFTIHQEVDKHALYELNEKIEILLEKKEEDFLNHKEDLERKRLNLIIKRNERNKSNSNEKNNNSFDTRKIETENECQENKLNKSTNVNKELLKNKIKDKKFILSYKNINSIASGLNKKSYFIATTLFLDEYNLLLISTTDNIISAWKYREKEEYFDNVNLINQNIENSYNKKKCIFEKNEILIPLLMTEYTQYTMCFDFLTNYLYTGQTDGKILKWDITLKKPILILDINDYNEKNNFVLPMIETSNNEYQKETKEIALKRGQSEFNKILKSLPEKRRNMISCLIFISPLKILCSAHYNGLIILWDIVYNRPKRIYNDQKTGIYQILYNYNMNHLYTCGFDHDILIYDPYIGNEAIYKLKGHKSSINSISLIPENNELISIDILGIIKIWDITNFFNFQTININDKALLKANNINEKEEIYNKIYKKKISANLHIQTFPDLSKFLIYGKKFLLFEKGNSLNPYLCDDFKIIGCFYNPKTNNIITISLKKIQFWNIFNGKLIKIFRDLMSKEKLYLEDNTHHFENINNNDINYDITSFAHDINYKKLYLGDSTGRIKSFYLETGELIKQFESHRTEITDIIYSFKYDYLITCSTDLIIKFHNDNEQLNEKNNSIREFELIYEKKKIQLESRIKKIFLRKVVLNEEKGILITCLSNGYIKELDIGHFKFINEMDCLNIKLDNLKNLALITSVEYIKDIDMLFIALDNGDKKFVVLKNNDYFKLLLGKDIYIKEDKIQNNNNDYKNKKYIIEYSLYDDESHKLFIGDSFGNLICYDLTALCDCFTKEKSEDTYEIENLVKKGLNSDIIFKMNINNEPINYICKPKLLNPEILIVLSIEKTAKLIDFYSGNFIDSLKQISINENPFPIAVKYSINTPYVKNKKSKDNNTMNEQDDDYAKNHSMTIPNESSTMTERIMKKKFPYIIYRKNIKFENKSIKQNPNVTNGKRDLIQESYSVLLQSVKEKLRQPKFSKEIPHDKSTFWKYEINLNKLKEIEEEYILKINEKIKKKEVEINNTENDFVQFKLYDKNYIPNYIKDLSQEEKDKMKYIINKKIKDVNLYFNKRELVKSEIKNINKEKRKTRLSLNNIYNLNSKKNDVNLFITPIKPIKTNIITKSKSKEKTELPIIKERHIKNNESKQVTDINKKIKMNNRYKIVQSPNRQYHNLQTDIFSIKRMSKEDKFNEFKIQFDEKINEIKRPIEFFKLRKKHFNI